MVIVALELDGIYKLLAFVVALFFPLALLTWLVIDKFFASGDEKARPVRRQPNKGRRSGVLADHSRRGA